MPRGIPFFFSLHSPMAEADDLKSSKCGFESHWRHQSKWSWLKASSIYFLTSGVIVFLYDRGAPLGAESVSIHRPSNLIPGNSGGGSRASQHGHHLSSQRF